MNARVHTQITDKTIITYMYTHNIILRTCKPYIHNINNITYIHTYARTLHNTHNIRTYIHTYTT